MNLKVQKTFLPYHYNNCVNQALQGSYSFKLFKFHDFFHDLFKISKTLGLAVTFKNFKNFPCFRVFLDFKEFNRHKLWCSQKCVAFALFNYSSSSYILLAQSPAVTNLSNKTLILHDLQGPTIEFHDFPGLENESLKFHDFLGFPWPLRTLFAHTLYTMEMSVRIHHWKFRLLWSKLTEPLVLTSFSQHLMRKVGFAPVCLMFYAQGTKAVYLPF